LLREREITTNGEFVFRWRSTLDKGATANAFTVPNFHDVNGSHPSDICVIASLRGSANSWNANGLVQEQLARGMGKSSVSCDVKFITAKHGDFMCSSNTDPVDSALGHGGIIGWLMGYVGLASSAQNRQGIQEAAVAFCKSVLSIEPTAYGEKIQNLILANSVVVGQIDASFPSMREKMPSFM
jgi:hypothetical protein